MKTYTWIVGIGLIVSAGLAAQARTVNLDVQLTNPVLETRVERKVILKIGLEAAERERAQQRAPVNMALVIDKSGSMRGDRIRQARMAALAAVDRLRDDDIISVVAFDDEVQILVPATRASNRDTIRRGIEKIRAGGSTALFAGVSKGAAEVRKFLEREQVNRIILLSDGQANVGPRTPGALGELGVMLMKERMAVSTIGLGLGYNEDLMVRLARESDGNHAFVEHPNDLARIFDREFGAAMSVIAQDVEIRIDCAEGIRPLRTLGRSAEIAGQTVTLDMNQLYGGQQRYVLLEVEVPAQETETKLALATVTASFDDLNTSRRENVQVAAAAEVTSSRERAQASINQEVVGQAVLQEAAEANDKAIALRDEGRVEEAREVLAASNQRLNAVAEEENLPVQQKAQLRSFAAENTEAADALEDQSSWGRSRKKMRASQYEVETQRYR